MLSIQPLRSRATSILTPLLCLPGAVYLFVITYSSVLFCLLSYQSLWVDELLQLVGTRSGTLEHIEQLTASGVGGVPLSWFPQLLAIRCFGYSAAIARLPSALAAIGCCLIVFWTARGLKFRYPLVPMILLSVLPLYFRYALEARPYAQGVLLSALATLVFIKLIDTPSISLLVVYTTVIILGIYSQPFACFTACSHFVWAMIAPQRKQKLLCLSGGALIVMALAFLPWYAYGSPLWAHTIRVEHLAFHPTWRTPLMLIREITGAGYLGGVLLLSLALAGFLKGSTKAAMKLLLIICSIVPVICVLVVDFNFGYFLAIRQMIFILPPLVILASDGLSFLLHSAQLKTAIATALIAIVLMGADLAWLLKPREDWSLAANAIEKLQEEYSACTLIVPPSSIKYYAFFEPHLAKSACPSNSVGTESVILVIAPYSDEMDRANMQARLNGKHNVDTQVIGMSTVQVFR